jgi:hypothetical protein
LECFHDAHLGPAPVAGSIYTAVGEADKEDDELGYYADGTKRTLTDDEIAIFRHSEIQQLIRAQRDRDLDDVPEDTQERGTVEQVLRKSPEAGEVDASIDKTSNRSQRRPARFSNTGNGARSNKRRRKNDKASAKKASMVESTTNIRNDPNDYILEGETQTLRRIAREMDELRPDSIELDY